MPPRKPEGVIPDVLTDLKDVDDTVTLQDGFSIHWDAARKMWVPGGGALQSWIWVQFSGSGNPVATAGNPWSPPASILDDVGALHGTDLSWDIADAGNVHVHTQGVYQLAFMARWAIDPADLPTVGVIGLLVGGSQPEVQDYSAHFPPGQVGTALVAGSVGGAMVFDDAAMGNPDGTGNVYFGLSNFTDKPHMLWGADLIVTRLA